MLLLRRRPGCWPSIVSLACAAGLVAGCASPGSPRPPSLHLPEPVRDLSALRSGDEVQLRFSVPRRTTDGQSIAEAVLHGTLCRQDTATSACKPVSLPEPVRTLHVPASAAQNASTMWVDHLPPELCNGAARPIAYRITLSNAVGRSAGMSDPVYTAAGAAPPPVLHLKAIGSRSGVLLQWAPAAGKDDVLLKRTQLDPPPEPARTAPAAPAKAEQHTKTHMEPGRAKTSSPAAPGTVILQTSAQGGAGSTQTIDNTVDEGVRYAYEAVRQTTAQVGGRTLVLQSAASDPVEIAWRDVYPPPAPQQLTALGYVTTAAAAAGTNLSGPQTPGYAVDLIWQPVDDPRVIGYLVTRQALEATGELEGTAQPLNVTPVKTPGFHDSTAEPGKSYRYRVVAVDAKGNRSTPAMAQVDRQSSQP